MLIRGSEGVPECDLGLANIFIIDVVSLRLEAMHQIPSLPTFCKFNKT